MKSTDTPQKGLLEEIHEIVGCENLSDLHNLANYDPDSLIRAVNYLKKSGYSLEEWSDAVRYLTKEEQSFESEKGAVSFLIDFLRKLKE